MYYIADYCATHIVSCHVHDCMVHEPEQHLVSLPSVFIGRRHSMGSEYFKGVRILQKNKFQGVHTFQLLQFGGFHFIFWKYSDEYSRSLQVSNRRIRNGTFSVHPTMINYLTIVLFVCYILVVGCSLHVISSVSWRKVHTYIRAHSCSWYTCLPIEHNHSGCSQGHSKCHASC